MREYSATGSGRCAGASFSGPILRRHAAGATSVTARAFGSCFLAARAEWTNTAE